MIHAHTSELFLVYTIFGERVIKKRSDSPLFVNIDEKRSDSPLFVNIDNFSISILYLQSNV